mgnify:CR=1 FL=1
MGKIQIMSSKLANMIAAGEVIERPSSVIKELVENSIDAHAKNIEVSIFNAGRNKIIVKDDGDGMDPDDAKLAFKRHASSKLLDEYQLFKIKTMGFRGEALPSISSVSKVTMMTSTGNIGSKVTTSEEELNIEPFKAIKGTTFIVEELFYNTPVRLKYLKSDSTEIASCLEVMQRLALSFPNVAMSFYIDDKLSFSTTGRGDLLEVISRLYGNDVAKKMIKVSYSSNGFDIDGYIGKPEVTRSTRYYMITILNNRNVYLPQVQKSIISGYSDYIFNSKYPFVVLTLRVDHSLVDVNVHPSKKEVRLSNDREVSSAVEEMIKEALNKENAIHEVSLPHKEVETVALFKDNTSSSFDTSIIRPINPRTEIKIELPNEEIKENNFDFDINSLDEEINVKNNEDIINNEVNNEINQVEEKNEKTIPYFRVVGQVLLTYIIIEIKDGFYIVDQHAANERINYEKFTKLLNSKIEVCTPLIPLIINLSPSEIKRLTDDKIKILNQIGIEVEGFGLNTIKISSIPVFIKEYSEEKYLEEIIDQVIRTDKIDLIELRKHVIATMACKASIKANDHLEIREMEDLIKTLFTCDNPTCCPHGRPTIVHFTKYDIEKMFKRSGI